MLFRAFLFLHEFPGPVELLLLGTRTRLTFSSQHFTVYFMWPAKPAGNHQLSLSRAGAGPP